MNIVKKETDLNNVIYSDIRTSFVAHPVRKDITTINNEEAVKTAIKNLILTNFYERPFAPSKGSGLYGLLFEPMVSATQSAIVKSIETTIKNYESRAKIISVEAIPNYDENYYNVVIKFTLLNSTKVITLSSVLHRIR